MKKGKNLMAICLCLAMCYIPMQAAGYYRTKNVQYGGVNLYYNGAYQKATAQAVIIDGTTYLPVRAFGNMLGINIDWNQNTQTVTINGLADTVLSAQAELQAKNYEIAALRKELETLKNEGVVSSTTTSSSGSSSSSRYETTSGTDILGTEITATRRALENQFGDYFDDIEFDFSLSLSGGRLRVTISIDNASDYREFNRLSRSDVKEFIEEVCEEIRDRHDHIAIIGTIEYTNSNKDLYSFNYSKSDYLTYSQGSSSNWSSESSLLRIIDRTNSVKIDGYDSGIDIKKSDVSISDSREEIEFELYLDLSSEDAKKAWNNNTGTDNDRVLRSYLKDIAEDLEVEVDYDIECTLYDDATNHKIGYYDYEDNEIVLYTI